MYCPPLKSSQIYLKHLCLARHILLAVGAGSGQPPRRSRRRALLLHFRHITSDLQSQFGRWLAKFFGSSLVLRRGFCMLKR
ncbi:hypothetical protein BAUCODRAFT_35268 [Baudoinia panamericana UAMH 10762]|uniref:Uncharacterized protein n=1 Tax=Baudoinia panamericana (strain UAMH 10762) TaxID=717646 RepID=M2N8X3_BAUPA|nr:uncharacterized protein BAUCODRAFT_35268 [Baudoinia panamericana UAMH 10762]EMC95285.1 hypothetical protein BAUCODRAFT_35268 [Baudoinia panamericana UAMH 10762]